MLSLGSTTNSLDGENCEHEVVEPGLLRIPLRAQDGELVRTKAGKEGRIREGYFFGGKGGKGGGGYKITYEVETDAGEIFIVGDLDLEKPADN